MNAAMRYVQRLEFIAYNEFIINGLTPYYHAVEDLRLRVLNQSVYYR